MCAPFHRTWLVTCALLIALTLGKARSSDAQTCPVQWRTVPGRVRPADGSIYSGPFAVYAGWGTFGSPNPVAHEYGGGFEVETGMLSGFNPRFWANNPHYFESEPTDAVSCYVDAQNCTHCGGVISISMYAVMGALEGDVVEIPSRRKVAGADVNADYGLVKADSNGHFEFRAPGGVQRQNHWFLPVNDPGGGGSGTRTYRLFTPGAEDVHVTISSSKLSQANLNIVAPYVEGPEERCEEPPTNLPSAKTAATGAGLPVNVVTGNVYFDQSDARIAGVRGLAFTRSYNSRNAFRGTAGLFGRGWTHSYEMSITGSASGILALRQGNGVAIYFQDTDGDLNYEASLPITEQSWIERHPTAGTYTRHFPTGGFEAYATYAGVGRLVGSTDEWGNTVTITRDPSSAAITTITDPSGRYLTLEYDGARLARLTGSAGLRATYSYQGDVLDSVAYPDGSGYRFTYDDVGQLLTVTDFSERIVESHTYDGTGRGLTSERSDGVETLTFSYENPNPAPKRTTVTDARGNVTHYDWDNIDGMKRVVRITGPCFGCGGDGGESQAWTYDVKGQVLTYTNGTDNTWKYTYYDDGYLKTVEEPAADPTVQPPQDPLQRTTTYTYADGRLASVARPDGSLVTYTHTFTPERSQTIVEKVTESQARTTLVRYTAQGKIETIADPLSNVTEYEYYGTTGDLHKIIDAADHVTTFEQYNSFGLAEKIKNHLNEATTTTYDQRGRVARIADAEGGETDFTYDTGGRRTSVTDPLERSTTHTYDAYGRMDSVVDAAGGITRYAYDAMSNLTALTDARGNTTAFAYDTSNRVETVTYPNADTESYTYDDAGRLLTKRDRKDVTTTYHYDGRGLLALQTYSPTGPPSVSFTYDAIGRMLTAVNGTDTLTLTYDYAGQLLTEQSTKNASLLAYTYFLDGQRKTVSLNGSLIAAYDYYPDGLLETITQGAKIFEFDYDGAHRRTELWYPSAPPPTSRLSQMYGYTPNGSLNLVRLSVGGGSSLRDRTTYQYDAAGNRLSKMRFMASDWDSAQYRYDRLDRLVQVSGLHSIVPVDRNYGYDAVGNRVTLQSNQFLSHSLSEYTYDSANRLTSHDGDGVEPLPLHVRGALSEPVKAVTVNGVAATIRGDLVGYDGDGFEVTVPAVAGVNRLTVVATDTSNNSRTQSFDVTLGSSSATYHYDDNGNLTDRIEGTSAWKYEWDVENRLTRVLLNQSEVARFAYDPLGRRVEKVSGGVTQTYTYDGEDILRHNRGGGSIWTYTHGPGIDEPLARENETGVWRYFHQDGLGSVTMTTNTSGAVTETIKYDAFGQILAGNPPAYAFTGREWDGEVGLYYYRARYYDPKVGRFISEDPIGFRGGDVNLYAYVSNSPTGSVDPFGMWVSGTGTAGQAAKQLVTTVAQYVTPALPAAAAAAAADGALPVGDVAAAGAIVVVTAAGVAAAVTDLTKKCEPDDPCAKEAIRCWKECSARFPTKSIVHPAVQAQNRNDCYRTCMSLAGCSTWRPKR